MMYQDISQAVCYETELIDTKQTVFVGDEKVCQGVNELAVSSVRAAVASVQMFMRDYFGKQPAATIDCSLVDRWCVSSVIPKGWSLPSQWDEFARDYKTRDGWIRLHTNARHHRERSLTVLENVSTPQEAQEVIATWSGFELETAIAEAGGCAATLRTQCDWQSHPQGVAVAKEPIVNWNLALASPHRWKLTSPMRPLSGLRVLDLTRVIAGPVATRFLASLGANVLRIDPPHWNEGGNSIDLTVGKRCAELNLHVAEDYVKLIELIKSAHVLVHGYRKDALPRLGFSEMRLKELNPALISVGLNAYGATGPWKNRRGFDSLVQRSSGLAVERSGVVNALPYQVLDHSTGYLAAAAVIQALRLQNAGGPVASAHLSLARQARLLAAYEVDSTVLAGWQMRKGESPGIYTTHCNDEDTDWGPILRLPLPFEIKGVNLGWSTPAKKLRTFPPLWSSEASECNP